MLWLPQSWSVLCWAVVVHRLTPVLFLALPGCAFAQTFLNLGLASGEMWLFTSLSRSLS